MRSFHAFLFSCCRLWFIPTLVPTQRPIIHAKVDKQNLGTCFYAIRYVSGHHQCGQYRERQCYAGDSKSINLIAEHRFLIRHQWLIPIFQRATQCRTSLLWLCMLAKNATVDCVRVFWYPNWFIGFNRKRAFTQGDRVATSSLPTSYFLIVCPCLATLANVLLIQL